MLQDKWIELSTVKLVRFVFPVGKVPLLLFQLLTGCDLLNSSTVLRSLKVEN